MNKSGFELLEDKIKEVNGDSNKELYERLDELMSSRDSKKIKYGEMLKYSLACSQILNSCGYENEYFHIGGFATLFHLIRHQNSLESINSWRGSEDLDVVGLYPGIECVLGNYFDVGTYRSNEINKKKLEIKDPFGQEHCDMDLYERENGGIIKLSGRVLPESTLREFDKIDIMGVEVNVAKAHDQLGIKLGCIIDNPGHPREKDHSDIHNLTGIIENDPGLCEKYPSIQDKARYLLEKIESKSPQHVRELNESLNSYLDFPPFHTMVRPSFELISEFSKLATSKYKK